MAVNSITPIAVFNDLANVREVPGVQNVEQSLNRMYFEIMLKSAFKLASSEEGISTGVGMYTDMYVQNMIDEFSDSHNLGFGHLQLNNDSIEGEK